jgi:diguanylate cyclase (GGDEF)-like protein/PAS domain S-box-containing protein
MDRLTIKNHLKLESSDNSLSLADLLSDRALIQVASMAIGDATIVVDRAGYVLYLNPVAEQLLGWQSSEVLPLSLNDLFKVVGESALESSESLLEAIWQENRPLRETTPITAIAKDERSLQVEYAAAPLWDNLGQILGAILVLREVVNSTHGEREAILSGDRDSLTGLSDRYGFERSLEEALLKAKTIEQQHVLCYLDLDRFKVINETCGHAAGDDFLRQVSTLLCKRVRKSDLLARLEGDKFGLILYQCNLEQAISVVQTLRQAVEEFCFSWNAKTFNLSISVGIVAVDADSESASCLLKAVCSACNTAKSKGRNRISLYQPNDLDFALQQNEVQWVPRIFKAIEQNQFLLYVQPIVSLKTATATKQVTSYEVLLRLQDEEGKIIPPGQFIPAAEKYGLMHLVDRWVIRSLFAYLERQSRQNNINNCFYTINLSGASLNDDGFFDFVREQFSLYSVSPEYVCFEITETVAISNISKVNLLIRDLKTMGCHIALDDFGSGMSSFGYLKSLPIDYLKIDGMFIKDILHSQIACEIVSAINRIAHVMQIQTVAEYVENDEIFDKLSDFEVDYAQGYGISKPYPLI